MILKTFPDLIKKKTNILLFLFSLISNEVEKKDDFFFGRQTIYMIWKFVFNF